MLVLETLQVKLRDGRCEPAKVSLSPLVEEDICDEFLYRSELDVLVFAQNTTHDVVQANELEHVTDEGNHLDDKVATTVALAVELLVLCEAEHHLDDHDPDLVILPQHLVGVTLHHLHHELEHSLEQRDQLALAFEHGQFYRIGKGVLLWQIRAVDSWNKVGLLVLKHGVDAHFQLLEVADIQVLLP